MSVPFRDICAFSTGRLVPDKEAHCGEGSEDQDRDHKPLPEAKYRVLRVVYGINDGFDKPTAAWTGSKADVLHAQEISTFRTSSRELTN